MGHGKRNSRTLLIRMSKIQTAEKENDQGHEKWKTKHRETTKSTTNDKAHDRIHQEHKEIRIIE
jgi:hypothetical protein